MKCLLLAAVITSVLFVLAPAGNLCAGVVMTETSITSDPTGETSSLDRTVYVQGNKQKVERSGVTTITDLDKSIIYIIDNKDRAYTEVPLHVLGSSEQADARGDIIEPFDKIEPSDARGETVQLNKPVKCGSSQIIPAVNIVRVKGATRAGNHQRVRVD